MNERHERMTGAVDREAFEKVIRDNLSPEAVATIIAFLQPASIYKTSNPETAQALIGVQWFADTLTELLGGDDELCRLMNDLWL